MRQHDLLRPPQQEGQRTESRAMRRRCRQQMCVAFVEPVDIGIVALAGEQQVPVGQYRALRPACRAGGVEQPGAVGRLAGREAERLGSEQRLVFAGAGRDHLLQRFD
jgi:hypothetical protein